MRIYQGQKTYDRPLRQIPGFFVVKNTLMLIEDGLPGVVERRHPPDVSSRRLDALVMAPTFTHFGEETRVWWMDHSVVLASIRPHDLLLIGCNEQPDGSWSRGEHNLRIPEGAEEGAEWLFEVVVLPPLVEVTVTPAEVVPVEVTVAVVYPPSLALLLDNPERATEDISEQPSTHPEDVPRNFVTSIEVYEASVTESEEEKRARKLEALDTICELFYEADDGKGEDLANELHTFFCDELGVDPVVHMNAFMARRAALKREPERKTPDAIRLAERLAAALHEDYAAWCGPAAPWEDREETAPDFFAAVALHVAAKSADYYGASEWPWRFNGEANPEEAALYPMVFAVMVFYGIAPESIVRAELEARITLAVSGLLP